MNYLLMIATGYVFQMVICSIINSFLQLRNPKNVLDFIKMTFLPYLIYKLNKRQ